MRRFLPPRSHVLSLCVFAGLLLAASPAGAVMVDFEDRTVGEHFVFGDLFFTNSVMFDVEVFQFSVPAVGEELSDESGLPTSDVLSGDRRVRMQLDSGTSASATLSPNGGDDASVFSVAPNSEARSNLVYNFTPTSFGLTQGGGDRCLVAFGPSVPSGVRWFAANEGKLFRRVENSVFPVSVIQTHIGFQNRKQVM
jgi:hypothetical protein